MSPKLTEQADTIRKLIVEDELDKAFPLLMDLAKKADGNYWDESLNLNQDYTKLNNETRSGFLTPIQEETNRNRLIDKMLKLLRVIEENNADTPAEEEKKVINASKTVEVKSYGREEYKRLLYFFLITFILGAVGALIYVQLKKEPEPAPPEPARDICAETIDEGIDAFKEGNLDKAERIFISAEGICEDKTEAKKWLDRTEIQRRRNEPQTSPDVSTVEEKPKTETEKRPVEKPKVTEPKEEKTETDNPIIPVKPTFPDEDIAQQKATYREFLRKGNAAFQAKNYPAAYNYYTQARAAFPKIDAQEKIVIAGKLETARDLAYREFFSKGMDYYNAENYRNALTEFKKAQQFKDFSQVRGMIRRCENAL